MWHNPSSAISPASDIAESGRNTKDFASMRGTRHTSDLDGQEASVAMIRTDALREFPRLVKKVGGDPAAILRKFRIEPRTIESRNGTIPYRAMVQLLEYASVELNCPDFGMRLAAEQEGKIINPMALAVRNSPTLYEAFKYCEDHAHVFSEGVEVSMERLPNDSRIFVRFNITLKRLSHQRQAIEYQIAYSHRVQMMITNGLARTREVWFSHKALAPPAAYQASFDAPVQFGQTMNGLFLDERDMHLALPDAEPRLYEMGTAFIDQNYPAAEKTLVKSIRPIVRRLLMERNCTQEHLAAALAMHPRTLQRRLKEEGQSFEAIKDSVRREAALWYLRQRDIPLVEVAAALGYSETSVLSRSCSRWFSASPKKLREKLTREENGPFGV
jgi:AraC-like DNA-binding protein